MDAGTDIAQELGVSYRIVNAVPSVYDYKKPMAVTYETSNDYRIIILDTPTCLVEGDFGMAVVSFILDLFSCLYQLSQQLCSGLTLVFRCVCIALHAMVPRCGWWTLPQYHFSFMVISCWIGLAETTWYKCRKLKLIILRSMFRRSDFANLWNSIYQVHYFTVIFLLMLHLMSRGTAMVPSVAFSVHNKVSSVHVPPLMQLGGGRIPLFSLEELLPHIDHSGEAVKLSSNLKFVGHRHKNVAGALYKQLDDHVFGKVPMDIFLKNLTQKDAKSIAKIHGVHV